MGAPAPAPAAYCRTWNLSLLFRVLFPVVTLTKPLVAPAGTVASISVADTTVNIASTPLKLTAVEPVRFVPRIRTVAPTLPDLVSSTTNGLSPADTRKMVPHPLKQCVLVAPPV